MPLIVMYTSPGCPFCEMAKRLLTEKGQTWTEIDVGAEPGRRSEMIERSGRTTVPQIWIGDRHVGGFEDLADLERRGDLDRRESAAGHGGDPDLGRLERVVRLDERLHGDGGAVGGGVQGHRGQDDVAIVIFDPL